MISHVQGPVSSRRHDWFLYQCSDVGQKMMEVHFIDGVQYGIYGDSRYDWRTLMEAPFHESIFNNAQEAYNASTSKFLFAMEWIFKKARMYFSMATNKNKIKLWQASVGLLYASTLFRCNFGSTIYLNQSSSFSDLLPSSLEKYITNRRDVGHEKRGTKF